MSDKSNVGLSSFFPLGSPIWAVAPPINAEKYIFLNSTYYFTDKAKYKVFYT